MEDILLKDANVYAETPTGPAFKASCKTQMMGSWRGQITEGMLNTAVKQKVSLEHPEDESLCVLQALAFVAFMVLYSV